MNSRNENIKYALLVGFVIATNTIATSYLTYYLTNCGMTDYSSGIVMAVSCLLATVLCPVIGRIADQSELFRPKLVIVLFMLAQTVISILLLVLNSKYMISISFGLLAMNFNTVVPIIYAVAFKYKQYKIKIDFGIARGMGSLFFAITSVMLGYLTENIGNIAIPIVSIVLNAAVLVLSLMILPNDNIFIIRKREHKAKKIQKTSLLAFIKKYPLFILVLVGITFMMTFHTMIMMFIIRVVERVGCGTNEMGAVMGVSAFVEMPALFFYSKINKKYRASTILIFSSFSFVIKAFLLLIAQDINIVYFAMLFRMTSYGLLASARVYLTEEIVEKKDSVTGQAFTGICDTISSVLGSFVGGMLITQINVDSMLIFGLGCALIGAIITVLSLLRHKKHHEE